MKKVIILAVFIPIILLLFNLRLIIYDFDFYDEEFKKLGVYDEYPTDVIEHSTKELIGFFKGKNDLKDIFFETRERVHLRDVKNLINKARALFYFLILVSLILVYKLKDRHYIGKSLFFGGVLSIALSLLLIFASLLSFDTVFYVFHKVSFDNDLWQLEENSNLIRLFPEQFFYDAFFRILIGTVIASIIFIIIGLWLKKNSKIPFVEFVNKVSNK